jgi:hypothetical protein
MLEQVAKFRKYDSKEATESGKERLKTEWGDTMRLVQTVWCNYEHIVTTAEEIKSAKGGRPRKVVSQEKADAAAAQAIRHAALQAVEDIETVHVDYVDVDEEDVNGSSSSLTSYDVPATSQTIDVPYELPAVPTEFHSYARPVNNAKKQNVDERRHTAKARKSRGQSSELFSFLSEKARLEQNEKKEELQFRKIQHDVSTKLQQEEIAYKKAKLEFDERKWKELEEDRKVECKRNAILNTFLENLLMGNLNKNT